MSASSIHIVYVRTGMKNQETREVVYVRVAWANLMAGFPDKGEGANAERCVGGNSLRYF